MKTKSITLTELHIIEDIITTEDGESGSVYGLHSKWTDDTEWTVRDITCDRASLINFRSMLIESDLEKIHFLDVIEDFII